jgi:hypothetical protein
MMDAHCIVRIADSSFRTQRTINHSLHEIDRRALNAMVLVKRHGNKLAGYGVIAQAFREQAVHLKNAASTLQRTIAPLVRVQMRILQHKRYSELFRRTEETMTKNGKLSVYLARFEAKQQGHIDTSEAEGKHILNRLVETVIHLQEGITEQEYVVTNGHIEAALSAQRGPLLMRVSYEMGLAVAKVRNAIWKYRAELEEILDENSTSL